MSAINMQTIISEEPNQFRRGIIQAFVAGSMLMPIVNFIKTEGMEYSYGMQTSLGGIAFRSLNGAYDPSAGIVNPMKEKLAILGGIVQMDHSLENSPTHANAIMAKAKAAGLYYDWACINGDPQTDPKAFYGLKSRIQAAQIVYAGADGADLTCPMLDEVLDKVVGPNNAKVLIMSKYQRRQFKRQLVDTAQGSTVADVTTHVDSYDGAKIVVMDEDDVPTTVLPQTETRGSCQTTGSIYCIRPGADPEGEYVQGIVRGYDVAGSPTGSNVIVHKVLAQTNTTIGDLIEMFGGLGCFHGRCAARLAGLK
jgi:hypothetical protein